MPEAVIVDAVRTPIGRAFKGSLAQLRPDEMGAFIVDALLERNPEVDPELIEEVYCGVRPAAGPPGLQHRAGSSRCCPSSCPLGTNGATVSRYCASSLESIRQAVERDRGRPGRRLHRRRRRVGLPLQRARRGRRRRRTRTRSCRASNGQPDAYISMGLTAENVAERTRSAAPTWTSTRSAPRSWPCSRRRTASSTARSCRSRCPDGTVVAKDDGPRASSTLEKLVAARARLQGGRQGHRRQLVPAERRRRRRARDVGHEGGRARA